MINITKYQDSTFYIDSPDDNNFILIEMKDAIRKQDDPDGKYKAGDQYQTRSNLGYYSTVETLMKGLLSLFIKRAIHINAIADMPALMNVINTQNEILKKIII